MSPIKAHCRSRVAHLSHRDRILRISQLLLLRSNLFGACYFPARIQRQMPLHILSTASASKSRLTMLHLTGGSAVTSRSNGVLMAHPATPFAMRLAITAINYGNNAPVLADAFLWP